MIAAVDLIRENRHITISEIAMEMNISGGSVHTIVGEELHYIKICARWIPRRFNTRNQGMTSECVFCASRTARAGRRDFLST
jgi:hypothetical protein